MAVKRDYYDILGVPKDADEAEIKRAFRRLAQRHHPDIDSGDGAEERFKELNEAYRVLSDRQRRTAYDMFGHAGVDGALAPRAPRTERVEADPGDDRGEPAAHVLDPAGVSAAQAERGFLDGVVGVA